MTEAAKSPRVFVFGGPNGAGKSTIHERVLATEGGHIEFVNADVIARGLAGSDPDRVAFAAGRIMLKHLRELAADRATFAFESTLASRTFAPFLQSLAADGYHVNLHYVWLRSAALAVQRVKHRASVGGHSVPPDTIARRYLRSAFNCRTLYLPICHRWHVYDNSDRPFEPIADGSLTTTNTIYDSAAWNRFTRITDDARPDDTAASDAQ